MQIRVLERKLFAINVENVLNLHNVMANFAPIPQKKFNIGAFYSVESLEIELF